MPLSEKRRAEEEGTAAAWAMLYFRFGADTVTERVRAFEGSRTALDRIKRRMWQHIEANRRTERALLRAAADAAGVEMLAQFDNGARGANPIAVESAILRARVPK